MGNVAHSSVGERGIGLRRKQFLVREKRLLIMEERTRERERERERKDEDVESACRPGMAKSKMSGRCLT